MTGADKDRDRELVARACGGDRAAFAALVEAHYDRMYRFARKWCGNDDDAADIAQEAAIRLARAIHGYDGRAAFTSWLYRIVVNCAIDWQRAAARQPQGDPALVDGLVAAGGDAEAALDARQRLARVDRLPEKERVAVLLVAGEGLSHAAAAAVMACKESTVSWYIHEARKKLGAADGKEASHG